MSDRVTRIETLRALLAERHAITAREIADELGVSVRTVRRDIATLRELGTPVEGERGRGGALRLEPGWSLGRVHLNESEALAALISIAVAEQVGSPLFLGDQRALARKIGLAFAPSQAIRIGALRRRILIGQPASANTQSGYSLPNPVLLDPLLRSFAQRMIIEIEYLDRQGRRSWRVLEPQLLYFNPPIWYLLAWDHGREGARTIRIDRIRGIRETGRPFRLRPAELFRPEGDELVRPL